MKLFLQSLLITSVLLISQVANATPIGTTPDTRPAAPQQRKSWETQGLTIQVGGNYFQGNVNLLNVNSSLSYNYNLGQNQFFADFGNIFTKAGDNVIADRINGTLLYAYNALDNLNVYYYMSHSHDNSVKLNYRLTNGVGVCVHKFASDIFDVFLISLGLSSENEFFKDSPNEFNLRSVLRLSITYPLNDVLDLGLDSFYMPVVNNFSDYRIYGEGFLNIKLIENILNLKLSVANEYDSKPVKDIKNNDFGVFLTTGVNIGY